MTWARRGPVVVALLIVGVAATSALLPDRVEANKALARRVFDEMLNAGNERVFDEIYSPDFVKHVDRHTYTLTEERAQARGMRVALPDLVMTIDTLIGDGDHVAVAYTGRGTSLGPFAGMPATGRSVVASGMTVYRIAGGKIVEEWTSYNELDIMRQLGYLQSPRP